MRHAPLVFYLKKVNLFIDRRARNIENNFEYLTLGIFIITIYSNGIQTEKKIEKEKSRQPHLPHLMAVCLIIQPIPKGDFKYSFLKLFLGALF
jgi:hypothetical protein